jgi:hypothetical protein
VTLSHMPESSVVKSVRLPRDLVDRLEIQAKAEHRTVNNLIAMILTEGIQQRPAVGGRWPTKIQPSRPPTVDSKDTSA